MAESESGPNHSGDGTGQIRLKKELGLLEGVAVILGIIIGSGIFIAPADILNRVGSVGVSLLVWTVCGLMSMLGAVSFAELGTTIPKSGGNYAYLDECFGSLPAFLFLWTANVIFIPVTNAVMGLTFGHYVSQPLLRNCPTNGYETQLLAALAISLLTFINCFNVRATTRLQNVFMVCKILALVVVIITGIVAMATGKNESFSGAFDNVSSNPSMIASAFYAGIYSFTGWNYLNYMTEELKEPYKNLPRAIYISLPLVTVIYVLANVAYLAVLSPAEMKTSPAIAVSFAERTMGGFSWIMPVLVAVSSFGALGISILTSSRLCFVGARNGHFPGFMSMINVKYLTPIPALVVMCVLSLFYLAVGNVNTLITYGTFAETVFIMLPVVGLLYLRWKRPDLARPIKTHISVPISYVLISGFVVVMSCYESAKEVGIGILIILTGVPVYYAFIHEPTKISSVSKLSDSMSRFTQKMFYTSKED